MSKFEVNFYVTDTLKQIKLSIKAIEPDKSAYNGTFDVSFVPKDSNFICKILKKPIKVVIKK